MGATNAVGPADHDSAAVYRIRAQKHLGFPPSPNPGPALFSLLGVQGILELVGGFLILIGLFTRPVAFILAGDMAVAYFMVHAPKSFFPALNGGVAAILFCFIYLYLFVAGGGPWSVDERRQRAELIRKLARRCAVRCKNHRVHLADKSAEVEAKCCTVA